MKRRHLGKNARPRPQGKPVVGRIVPTLTVKGAALAILFVQAPALAQTPAPAATNHMTPADLDFHELNREGHWAAALEHAREHLSRATTCDDSVRWQADLAIATTRVGLRQDALTLVYRTLGASCSDALGDHRFELGIAAGETYLALAKRDSALHFALMAMDAAKSFKRGPAASLDPASLIAQIAGCDDGLERWTQMMGTLYPQIEATRDSLALYDLRFADYYLLHELHECTPGREVTADSLSSLIDELVRLGAAIGRHPEALAGLANLKYGILAEAGDHEAAVRVLAAAAERALEPGSGISADGKVALLSGLSEGQMIAGDFAGALETARLAVTTSRSSDNALARVGALSSYGNALLLTGQTPEASVHLEDAERRVLSLGMERFLAAQSSSKSPLLRNSINPTETWREINEGLARIAGLSGAHRSAEFRFRRAYALSEAAGDSAAMRRTLVALANTRLLQGDSTGAAEFNARASEFGMNAMDGGPPGSPTETYAIMSDLMAEDTVRSRAAWTASERLLDGGLSRKAPGLAAGLHYRRALILETRYWATSDAPLLQSLIDEARLAVALLEDGPATQVLQFSYALLGTAFEQRAIAQGGDVASSEHLVESVRYHRLAIQAAAELNHPEWRARSSGQLAVVESYRGNTAFADSAFEQAIRAAEEARFLVARDEAVRSRHMAATLLSRVYADAIRFYYDQGRYGDALVIAELAKSRGLSDLMVQRAVERSGEPDSSGTSGHGSHSSIVSETGTIPEPLQQRLDTDAEERVRVDSAVAETFQESLRSTLSNTAIHELAVDSEFAVLSFYVDPYAVVAVGGDRFTGVVYAWLIDEGAVSGSAVLLTDDVQRQLDELARDTYESSPGRFGRGPTAHPQQSPATKQLLLALVGSLLDSLIVQSRAKTLVVIPDGRLNLIPFSALAIGDTSLGERFSLVVLPALHLAAVRQATGAAAPASDRFLGIVDPGGSLPRAASEVRGAAGYFERTQILTDTAATEEAIHNRWRQATVIHFATHAVAVDSVPNAGYISVATGTSSDGRLTVNEILGTAGLSAELVVLSACETGGGMVLEGEGIMGFGRAFLAAGAESVLVTLWPIDDRVAEFFMDRFYRHWRGDEMSIASAFQRAQASTRNRYPELRQWAAFRLIARNW